MSSLPKFQAFVINLDRSADRLAAMEQRLARTGLGWQRVRAVEGRELDLRRCPEIDVPGYERRHGKTLIGSEAGCYLSHLDAMRAFLRSSADYALLLEDDADFPPNFVPLLHELLRHTSAWDIVKLSSFHSGTPVPLVPLIGPYALAVPLSRHCNSNSVLINRHAARVLLRRLLPMRVPYDHALERAWLFGLKLRVVSPSPCPADTGLASTISLGTCLQRKFPLYQRGPAMAYRLVTELSRFGFGLMHVARAWLRWELR